MGLWSHICIHCYGRLQHYSADGKQWITHRNFRLLTWCQQKFPPFSITGSRITTHSYTPLLPGEWKPFAKWMSCHIALEVSLSPFYNWGNRGTEPGWGQSSERIPEPFLLTCVLTKPKLVTWLLNAHGQVTGRNWWNLLPNPSPQPKMTRISWPTI